MPWHHAFCSVVGVGEGVGGFFCFFFGERTEDDVNETRKKQGRIEATVEHLTAVPNIALLPWEQAVALVVLSVLLTSISGIIPASSAAKKDPVVALRTE